MQIHIQPNICEYEPFPALENCEEWQNIWKNVWQKFWCSHFRISFQHKKLMMKVILFSSSHWTLLRCTKKRQALLNLKGPLTKKSLGISGWQMKIPFSWCDTIKHKKWWEYRSWIESWAPSSCPTMSWPNSSFFETFESIRKASRTKNRTKKGVN